MFSTITPSKTVFLLASLCAGSSFAAVATFTPVGPSTVEVGTDIVFQVSVSVESMSGFDSADIVIGVSGVADVVFAYDAAWTSAFSSVTPPTYDVGFYSQDVFVGGNNSTSVGTTKMLGTVTIKTTNIPAGNYSIMISFATDGVSTLGLAGTPEPLNGSGALTVLGGPPPYTTAACTSNAACNPTTTTPPGQGVCISGGCYTPRNRYLSFYAPPLPPGASTQALRVTFGPMPGPSNCPQIPDFSAFNGVPMWVGSPHPSTGTSRLVSSPVFRSWGPGVINVSDCNIVPCASYTVQEVPDNCPISDPACFSLQTILPTSAFWGDIRGSGLLAALPAPPNGAAADFVDIGMAVDRFGGNPMVPASERSRCDVAQNCPTHGGGPIPPSSNNIDFFDIGYLVEAFRGLTYPFAGPSAPAPCPQPCTYP